MLVRPVARLLLAAPFVYDGIDAARHPDEHAAVARPTVDLVTRLAQRPPLTPAALQRAVRAHGAVTALAALSLATGKAPRTSALALTLLTVPLAVATQPFARTAATEHEDRGARMRTFLRTLALVGATLLGAADTAGRPSVSWRVQHALDERRAEHAES